MLAERRLGHVPGRRGGGDGAVAVDRDEGTEPFEVGHKNFNTTMHFSLFGL